MNEKQPQAQAATSDTSQVQIGDDAKSEDGTSNPLETPDEIRAAIKGLPNRQGGFSLVELMKWLFGGAIVTVLGFNVVRFLS